MSTKAWNLEHKEEMRQYRREWYCRNKDNEIRKSGERRKTTRNLIRKFKEGKCCSRCSEDDPRALDWHHKDPKAKLFGIANGESWPMSKVLLELKKCELLCANCHRKLTIKYADVVQQ